MGDHQNGLASALVDGPQQLHHLSGVGCVQVAGGLVCQQQGRPGDERPPQAHPLLLPAGQLVREGIQLALDAQLLHNALQLARRRAAAVQQKGQQQVLLHGEQRDQIIELIHQPDLAAAEDRQRLVRLAGQVHAAQPHRTAGGPVHSAQQVHQGGFAGAGRPHDGHELALLHGKTHIVQGFYLICPGPIDLCQMLHFQKRQADHLLSCPKNIPPR